METISIRPETISNDFRVFLELISRFEFDFRRCGFFFWAIRIFGVFKVQSHTMWPYMCLCCGLFVPTQFHFECWWRPWRFMLTYTYICLNFSRCLQETWNHCGRSKASLTEHHGKCLTCKSFLSMGPWERRLTVHDSLTHLPLGAKVLQSMIPDLGN